MQSEEKTFLGLVILIVLANLAFWGLIIFVALHFIMKWW
jgi:hypothetical protein